jgi:hypothetical protein
MSDAQLKRILAENERIKEELEFSKNIIKVSEACKEYVESGFFFSFFFFFLLTFFFLSFFLSLQLEGVLPKHTRSVVAVIQWR